MKKKTIYHLIVDKSGSMSDCIDNTINGFNEQVNKIKALQREFTEQEITIGLTTFNDHVDHHFFQYPAAIVQPLNRETYRISGSTALYDAIGDSVKNIEMIIEETSKVYDTTVVVVVLTDGYENASRHYRLSQIKEMITRLEATEKWTFSFIGATLDAVEVAEQMSIKRQNSFAFEKSAMSSEVWDKLGNSMENYMSKKRRGDKLNNLFD